MGIVADVNLHHKNSLDYISIGVEPSNVPISFRGKYYCRSGSTMQELNGSALQQFVLKKMGRSWDDIPNEHATIKDLDRKAIKYFLDNGIAADRIDKSESNSSTQRVLENLGLITEDGKLKNAALLLFAKNPRRYFTCVEFKIGRFRRNVADLIIQDVIEGNIIQMTDRVVQVLIAKYLTSPIHYEGMKRRKPLEVPEDALREILYNAILCKHLHNKAFNRRTTLKSGKTQFTHKRLRSAMHSVDFYLPYLFTYQQPECKEMPNTNNTIEGTFTDLKKNLDNHSGMSKENRKRFISGFFLALKSKLEREK